MIGQRFREIFYFWWRHLAPLFLVVAPFALLNQAVQWWLGPTVILKDDTINSINLNSTLLVLMLRPLADAVIIAQLAFIQAGQPRGLLACLIPALTRLPALLATYFLMGIAVSLGWLAFFFPALWVYARLCFAPYQVLLRNQPPLVALQDAFNRSQDQQWPLLLVLVMVFLVALLVSSAISTLIGQILGNGLTGQALAALVAALLGTVTNVAVFRFWTLSQQPSS
ncbi:MAG: hypothetical protein R3292_02455 [Alcanivorax sp.]|nr:hypothetical protein [Alcanivorax sp.]